MARVAAARLPAASTLTDVPDPSPLPLTGARGELIHRLSHAIDQLALRESEALEAVALMQAVTLRVEYGPGRDILGADLSSAADRIGRRVLEVVEFGVDEAFLVRAIRDQITEFSTANLTVWRRSTLAASRLRRGCWS